MREAASVAEADTLARERQVAVEVFLHRLVDGTRSIENQRFDSI
jgi:hypothetical protein